MRNSLLILVGFIALTSIVTLTVYGLAIKEAKLIPVSERLKTQTNRGALACLQTDDTFTCMDMCSRTVDTELREVCYDTVIERQP